MLHAEAKLPESRPATADEPTLVHLKSQLLDLHKKGVGSFLQFYIKKKILEIID